MRRNADNKTGKELETLRTEKKAGWNQAKEPGRDDGGVIPGGGMRRSQGGIGGPAAACVAVCSTDSEIKNHRQVLKISALKMTGNPKETATHEIAATQAV